MSKSYLTGEEAETFYSGHTRQKERIAEAEQTLSYFFYSWIKRLSQ